MKRAAIICLGSVLLLGISVVAWAEDEQPQQQPAQQQPSAQQPESTGTGPSNSGTTPKPTTLPYAYRSPILAGTLSLIPGLGQIYNGQYVLGSLWLVGEIGLYCAAMGYMGVFSSGHEVKLGVESIMLLAVAGALHIFSIYDATTEAVRMNENLDKFTVAYDPTKESFMVAYRFRF